MSVQTGDTVTQVFTTSNPSTGVSSDADSLPTGTLWIDGVIDSATVTISDVAGTGRYAFSVTMPALTSKQRVQVIVSATISGFACDGEVWNDQTLPEVNVALWNGEAAFDPPSSAVQFEAHTASVDAQLTAIVEDTSTTLPALIRTAIGAGAGFGHYTDAVTDGVNPLNRVRVQLYTEPGRSGLVYEAYTDATGVFEMWPDPGTYYRWLDLSGYSFVQNVQVIVTET